MTKVAKVKLKKVPRIKLFPKGDDHEITEVKFKKPETDSGDKKKEKEKDKDKSLDCLIEEAFETNWGWDN